MNERANMQPYIKRNSGIDALEREIQQLKTALEVSESENDRLKSVAEAARDYLFASANPNFVEFCGETPDKYRVILVEAIEGLESK